jgi:hypothetical protein
VIVMWLVKDPAGAATLAHNGVHAISSAAAALGAIAGSFHG